jgi:steroid delta-isomerase-like uncharacterized protein
MATEENKTIVRRFLEEVWNREDLDILDEVIADTYIGHDPSFPTGEIGGRGALKGVLAGIRAGMPDAHVQLHDVMGEGDRTVVRMTVTGTHTGDLFGLPATGRQLSVESFLLSRLHGGRIVEEWALRDTFGLLQQAGAVPEPAAV